MATFQVIEYTGATLVRILDQHFKKVLPSSAVTVQLATTASFTKLGGTATPTVTLFLYRIVENPELRNAPVRTLPDGSRGRQALPLELCYLVTAWAVRSGDTPQKDAAAAAEEHRFLGVVLQAFHDSGEIGRADLVDDPTRPVWSQIDSLQVVLDSLPLEDHYRIWDAAEISYRLSLTYKVRVLGVEPIVAQKAPPVIDARFTAGEK